MKLRVNGKGSKCKESSANDRGSGRTQLRESSEEPKMAKSKAETESSRQTMPKTEATESCWANECGRGGRPGCKESKTNKTKPVLAELRRDDDSSACARSSTNTARSTCVGLRINAEGPKCKKSGANELEPKRPEL